MTTKATSTAEATDREILITRTFDAPRELVFRAWSDPEHLVRWFAPHGCKLVIHEFDFTPGGVIRHSITSPEGHRCMCKAIYREIVKPERIVYSISFCDKDGNFLEPSQVGADPEWPRETVVTVTFEEHEQKTKLTLHQTALESVARRTGAYPSWLQMFDRLSEELAKG